MYNRSCVISSRFSDSKPDRPLSPPLFPPLLFPSSSSKPSHKRTKCYPTRRRGRFTMRAASRRSRRDWTEVAADSPPPWTFSTCSSAATCRGAGEVAEDRGRAKMSSTSSAFPWKTCTPAPFANLRCKRKSFVPIAKVRACPRVYDVLMYSTRGSRFSLYLTPSLSLSLSMLLYSSFLFILSC